MPATAEIRAPSRSDSTIAIFATRREETVRAEVVLVQ
jgi:hypothetical protein